MFVCYSSRHSLEEADGDRRFGGAGHVLLELDYSNVELGRAGTASDHDRPRQASMLFP